MRFLKSTFLTLLGVMMAGTCLLATQQTAAYARNPELTPSNE